VSLVDHIGIGMRSLIRPLVLHVILQVRIAPPAAAARLIASSPRRHGARAKRPTPSVNRRRKGRARLAEGRQGGADDKQADMTKPTEVAEVVVAPEGQKDGHHPHPMTA
jgi:hypothetical protein